MGKALSNELQSVQYGSFPEIFKKFRELSEKYNGLPTSQLISAFGAVGGLGDLYTPNPYVQNWRIKTIGSSPILYGKTEVANMLESPYSNEQTLRQVEHALEYTSYPLLHLRRVYTELLTYRNYVYPHLADKKETERDDFWREWKLTEKLRTELRPEDAAHEIAGKALQEGKVFYHVRMSVDKIHNKVNYAFMQQLPSDWCRIVGHNNRTKYTVAFNLMYFCLPGTTPYDYGDLFLPYLGAFTQIVTVTGKTGVDVQRASKLGVEADIYWQNGRWFYWVTLPVDKVFTFEVDDAVPTVMSPFTGLFLDMIQLSQLEAIQLSLLQNPLISVLHGEIPYWNEKNGNEADGYKLSNAGRELFTAFWYKMMADNNTSGIGIYMAPLQNMKLETLSEVPGATEIVTKGYQDTMSKAGVTAIIPAATDARAGAVNVSLQIESKFAASIYSGMERMMNVLMARLNLKYTWKFKMFGDLASEKDLEKSAMDGMSHGILSDTLTYLAIHGRSLLDDIAVSDAVISSGVMEKRLPLISSYNAKQESSGLPPHPGRPAQEDPSSSDGHEGDADAGTAPEE